MRKNMIRQCCICGVVYGEKEPFEDKSVTHGLCKKCLKIEMKKLEGTGRKKNPIKGRVIKFSKISTWVSPIFHNWGYSYYWRDGKSYNNFDIALKDGFGNPVFRVEVPKGHSYPPQELIDKLRKRLHR
jgi:hypothetical protein